jgi:hypothetical protein
MQTGHQLHLGFNHNLHLQASTQCQIYDSIFVSVFFLCLTHDEKPAE